MTNIEEDRVPATSDVALTECRPYRGLARKTSSASMDLLNLALDSSVQYVYEM